MDRQPLRLITATAAMCAAAALTACSSPNGQDSPETPPTQQPTQQTTQSAATDMETTSESPSSSTTAADKNDKNAAQIEEVAEHFSTLAPPEFFEKLTSCTEADLEGSYDCTGADIGQFQFFDSESKAVSTTQVLTELRSSRIVEDSGERVVGWSTLGTSAIITVVDNEAGQVMQQMVSSDREDPRQRILKLGLAQAPKDATKEAEETTTPAS